MIRLFDFQRDAVERMHNGCVLVGGVGTGKTLTSLSFVYTKWLKGQTPVVTPDLYSAPKINKSVYVITTARKRDSLDWQREASTIPMTLETVDSWNNIKKYVNVKNAIFIFDETRIVGYGAWTKAFLKIAAKNQWILLSATPADRWIDFVPLFVANGAYKNKTEFVQEHVVYSRFSRYPQIQRYTNVAKLIRLKSQIVVYMTNIRHTTQHHETIYCEYDVVKFRRLMNDRWNIFENEPVRDGGQLCYLLRRVVNMDSNRMDQLMTLYHKHPRIIIFYNFDYELFLLRQWCFENDILCREWNGHRHDELPTENSWVYLCQYIAASEAWNAITTNCVVFYSPTYSYRTMVQAAGRIDRTNTPYTDLYYYHLLTHSTIDKEIHRALTQKRNFNESRFYAKLDRKKNMQYNRKIDEMSSRLTTSG